MRCIIILAALLTASLAAAASGDTPTRLYVDYTLGQVSGATETYQETSDRSWTVFDPDGSGPLPSQPHLNAVSLWINNKMVGAVVDNPALRTIQIAIIANTRESIIIRSLWLQQPWQPNTSYAVGDKVSGFTRQPDVPVYPNTTGYWTCSRAGISGQTEPMWTPFLVLPAGWADLYTPIAPSPFAASDFLGLTGETIHVDASPWKSVLYAGNISMGFALRVSRDITDRYIYLTSSYGLQGRHGPQFSPNTYDPANIYKLTVATSRLNDPDTNGVEWTYTADTSSWMHEGLISGAVTIKRNGWPIRYIAHGDTYSRQTQ